jgi:two-component system, chemotaxis family, CheB/CheR fusion protein
MATRNNLNKNEDVSADFNKAKPLKEIIKSDAEFPIVGIGASAGGLEALEQFFGNMPANNGMAFVVIQHLDPSHPGIMPELLQRITTMKVFQASDRLKVKANCLYVIPPNKSMSLLNGFLHLFDPLKAVVCVYLLIFSSVPWQKTDKKKV